MRRYQDVRSFGLVTFAGTRTSVCRSVRLPVVCPSALRTSASPSGPDERSLTDYHLVFMVFEVLLNHLAASPRVRVRLKPVPPSSPSVSYALAVAGADTANKRDRREENRRDEERCERERRTVADGEAGDKQRHTRSRAYAVAQCESSMHRRVGTRTVASSHFSARRRRAQIKWCLLL